MSSQDEATGGTARTVVFSYPEGIGAWGRESVGESSFQAYLRKKLDSVEAGDVTEEFVDSGCCGDTIEVPLRVESVEGGSQVGEDTEFEFTEREGGSQGGWTVQSQAAPGE